MALTEITQGTGYSLGFRPNYRATTLEDITGNLVLLGNKFIQMPDTRIYYVKPGGFGYFLAFDDKLRPVFMDEEISHNLSTSTTDDTPQEINLFPLLPGQNAAVMAKFFASSGDYRLFICKEVYIKNVADVLSFVGEEVIHSHFADPQLEETIVSIGFVGTNLAVGVQGLPATNIDWQIEFTINNK